MGHVHLIVSDIPAALTFWTSLGGVAVKLGDEQAVRFPGAFILLQRGKPSGPAAGSSVNHIAFSVPNVPNAMKRWKAAGLNTVPLTRNDQGFLVTPDGLLRVEVLEEANMAGPVAFHHIHFNLVEPSDNSKSPSGLQAWYETVFGAIPGSRKTFQAADIPGANLTFQVTKDFTQLTGTKDRVIDHIGFEVADLAAFRKLVQEKGIRFETSREKRRNGPYASVLLQDPLGTTIEVTQGLRGK